MLTSLAVHITHEAALKIGGIGAVLEGLLSTEAYNAGVGRTILAGPWPAWDMDQMRGILSPKSRLQVRWASRYDILGQVPPDLGRKMLQVEEEYGTRLLYGLACYGGFKHEVLLADSSQANREAADEFAFHLWETYGTQVSEYGHSLEFKGFVDLAVPLAHGISALAGNEAEGRRDLCAVAHDWMGLPTAFALRRMRPASWKIFFYAHEVAPVRRIVEEHPGHDTRFYNAMRMGMEVGLSLDSLFGPQHDLFKTPLIHAAAHCDGILAVSDLVADELRFMGSDFRSRPIEQAYNGVPARHTSVVEKAEARELLQAYCEILFGFRPHVVLTHVTRMVVSKALWRDAMVMDRLARLLRYSDENAVLIVLSTSAPTGRAPDQVRQWEEEYGWPVGHRADNGDLLGAEQGFFFDTVEAFNRAHANAKILLVNQFGWSRERCGQRMPLEMDFNALRVGTDVEFGQSIYEPFGIAQLEPLTHGAICCASSACGCGSLTSKVEENGTPVPAYLEADFVSLPADWFRSPADALNIGQREREHAESAASAEVATRLHALLDAGERDMTRRLEEGYEASLQMSWENMAEGYFLPALQRTLDTPG